MHLIHLMHNRCSRSRISYSDLVSSPEAQTRLLLIVCSEISHGITLWSDQEERSVGVLFEDLYYSHLLPRFLYLQLVKLRTVLMFASSLLNDDDTRCEFYLGAPGRDVMIC